MKKRIKVTENALRSRKGMTLTEVLVAMTLLVLIIFVFTPAFLSYFKNIRTAGELTKKTYERASLMERLVANKGGGNDIGYETVVTNVPLKLSAAGFTDVDFSTETYGKIKGRLVSENLNRGDSYATFYAASASNTMICFPASLTDDFLTKDITVVPKGFKFDDSSFAKSKTSGFHFEVYNTNSSGTQVKVDSKYYEIRSENDGNNAKIAVFTFKGANNVISFEHSPLYIKYCDDNGELYSVKIEIGAPEIIMVGEKSSDGNYYYYVTKGVDTTTGHMEILAKKMGGDAALKSAMNDVEWVAAGKGDDGNGGVNKYGYYVMGGDAGQVRRFWKNETTGNYYWGGDNLINYNRYSWLNKDGSTREGTYEVLTPTKTTQAEFKTIFRSPQEIVTFNGRKVNELFKSEKVSIFKYQALVSNYFTANITASEYNDYFLTLSGAAKKKTKKGAKKEYYGPDSNSSKEESINQISWLTGGQSKASKLNVDGYKTATDYEYGDDDSLITITSVGAIQINKSNPNYYESQDRTPYNNDVYPTKSYTLYCGYIPSVTDAWGWKTASVGWKAFIHLGTYGAIFDSSSDSWVPVGKFGDIFSTSSKYYNDSLTGVSYRNLLNYCDANTADKDTRYPYPSSNNKTLYYTAGNVTNGILATGSALPAQGNDYYITGGNEVDITVGYLSHPFAIALDDPEVPTIEGLTGSDYYFEKFNGISGKFDHGFFSGGLRDNVTMLDVKSFHDDLTGNNISLAVGYTVSYMLMDYSYATRCSQIFNTGIVYIRATGDGTESDTTGDLASGKGWSLKKETNVFHQFFGTDQYYGNDEGGFLGINKDGTKAILGWDTSFHRSYFNITSNSDRAPQASYSPNVQPGDSSYGTNCHPLAQTECTTCNWGTTGDGKPQAMWGTSNGTLISWFYDQENLTNSKITYVKKEFENYTWMKKIGSSKGAEFYDYGTVAAGTQDSFGFISTLTRINDVLCADDVWVVAGNQSRESDVSPTNICANGGTLANGASFKPYTGNGEHASYINVKYCADRTNNVYLWKAVKIADSDKVNIIQLAYSQGIWYAFGYIDTDGDGKNDADENAVMYYSTNPTSTWKFCKTRTSADSPSYIANPYGASTTAALTLDETTGSFKTIEVLGVNSMASQG